jgi:hypothetical protein
MGRDAQRRLGSGLANPYLDEAEEYISRHPYLSHEFLEERLNFSVEESYDRHLARERLVKKYSWAIPNDKAIKTVTRFSPIVDIGAGTGYWPWLLQQAGADVVAYDCEPGFNYQCDHEPWTEVLVGGEEKAAKHSDRTLMMVWPTYNTDFGLSCLRCYGGKRVVYVGESWGCTGSDEMEKYLEKHFHEQQGVGIPQWDMVHDYVRVFRRTSYE